MMDVEIIGPSPRSFRSFSFIWASSDFLVALRSFLFLSRLVFFWFSLSLAFCAVEWRRFNESRAHCFITERRAPPGGDPRGHFVIASFRFFLFVCLFFWPLCFFHRPPVSDGSSRSPFS